MTDIDIDFPDRDAALNHLIHTPATEMRDTDRRRHLCGVYFQNIPVDPLDGLAVWDYRAVPQGFFKIDFINNSIYGGVRDEAHLVELLTKEPPWEAFNDEAIVNTLAHVKNNFAIVQHIQPRSIEDLAVSLALVRPGKRSLIGKPRDEIDRNIWLPTKEVYYKRAHAISLAGAIVVQLNLLVEAAWSS